MSFNRRGTWGPKGKGPTGRNLCYCGCGREVPKGCRTTFSPKCYSDWAAKNDPATQRRLVRERDKGVCALCGVDTEKRALEANDTRLLISWLARRHAEELFERRELPMQPGQDVSAYGDVWYWSQLWVREEMATRFGHVEAASGHAWEADHILPVIEGGGECDLSNLRTLCLKCHRKETAALAKRRAAARQAQKLGLVAELQLT